MRAWRPPHHKGVSMFQHSGAAPSGPLKAANPSNPGAGRTILSLCDLTGTWSKPYRDAGYDVRQIDLQRGGDVRLLKFRGPVHGILAAPPCTHFSRAGAWLWPKKGEAALLEGLQVVDACLRAVAIYRPKWWALENPIGRLKDYLGEPQYKFDPYHFGDPWTKRTWLWGQFREPVKAPVEPVKAPVEPTMGDVTTRMSSSAKNARSATPPGFAKAFFEANP